MREERQHQLVLDPETQSGSKIREQWKVGGSDRKASTYNDGDPGYIPGLWRSSGEGNGYPL